MRTTGIALAAVAAAALALGLANLGSGPSRHPALRLRNIAPLELAGSHFRSHERVRVTATVSGARSARTVRASDNGSFVVAFPIGAGHCSAVRAVAMGNTGSRALLKRLPAPACMPQ